MKIVDVLFHVKIALVDVLANLGIHHQIQVIRSFIIWTAGVRQKCSQANQEPQLVADTY